MVFLFAQGVGSIFGVYCGVVFILAMVRQAFSKFESDDPGW
jgi:hypothetical protein